MSLLKMKSIITCFRSRLVGPRCCGPFKNCQHILTGSKNLQVYPNKRYTVTSGTPGAGAGKGGGAGGTVRESGGGLGKYGAAQEESYFYDKQKEALKNIKKKLKDKPDASGKEDK